MQKKQVANENGGCGKALLLAGASTGKLCLVDEWFEVHSIKKNKGVCRKNGVQMKMGV